METMRYELKYVLSLSVFRSIQVRLSSLLKQDEHGDLEGYRVRSLYFDTLDDQDLNASLSGISHRHKLRLRFYDNDVDHVKLELKIKEAYRSYKRNITLSKEDTLALLSGDWQVLKKHPDPEAQMFYRLFQTSTYRPKVMVEYQRIAYVHPFSKLRVCYDRDVRISTRNALFLEEVVPWLPIIDRMEGIFEVKYDQWILTSVQMMLKQAETNAVAFSKYVGARMREGGL